MASKGASDARRAARQKLNQGGGTTADRLKRADSGRKRQAASDAAGTNKRKKTGVGPRTSGGNLPNKIQETGDTGRFGGATYGSVGG